MRANNYKAGSWKVCCDRCGFDYHAEQLVLEWTGFRVCRGPGTNNCHEQRHPQESVRGVPDRQAPPWVRPCAPDHFIPLLADDYATVERGQAVALDLLANDTISGGDPRGVTLSDLPAAGTGALTYTDAASGAQTVVSGQEIAFADLNALTFTAGASAPLGEAPPVLYSVRDRRDATAFARLFLTVTAPATPQYAVAILIDNSSSTGADPQAVEDLKFLLSGLMLHLEDTGVAHDLYIAFASCTDLGDILGAGQRIVQKFTAANVTDFAAARAHIAGLTASQAAGVGILATGIEDVNDWFDTTAKTPMTFVFEFSIDGTPDAGAVAELAEWTARGGHRFIYGLTGPATVALAGYDNTAGDGAPNGANLTPDIADPEQLAAAFATVENVTPVADRTGYGTYYGSDYGGGG